MLITSSLNANETILGAGLWEGELGKTTFTSDNCLSLFAGSRLQFMSLFSSVLIITFTTGSSVHDITFSISVIFNRSDTLLSLLVIFVFLTKCPVIIFKNVSSASVSVICLPILKISFSQLFLVVFMSSILSSVRINSVLWLIKLYFWILASCELKPKFSQSSTVLIGWDLFWFIFDKLFSLFNDLRIITFSLFAFSESLSSLL